MRALRFVFHPGLLVLVAIATLAAAFSVAAAAGCSSSVGTSLTLLFVSSGAAAVAGLSFPLHPDFGDVVSKGSVVGAVVLCVVFGFGWLALGGLVLVIILVNHCQIF